MPALALNPSAAGCWCCVAVHGAGAGAASWLCKWKQVAGSGAGAGCRVPLLVPGAGAVSWLCTWWRQVAGAGAGCRVPVLVLVLSAGCARSGDRLLAVQAGAVETGCCCRRWR